MRSERSSYGSGDDPAEDCAQAPRMPRQGDTLDGCIAANPNRSKWTNQLYCYETTAAERTLVQQQPLDLSSIDRYINY